MAKGLAIFVLLLLCNFTSAARKPKHNSRSGSGSTRRPNIVFILTDDLDNELGSPNVMTKTHKILRQEGADFVNAFVTTPMCCPSRASILTGSYAHNHNTFTNNINCSSPSWRRGPERKSYARYLESSGYVTGYFGKYLNEYDGSWVPVGWNKWEGLLLNSKFYNYTIRHNTYKERHRMNYAQDYFTDFITNRSISFIKRTKENKPNSPFLAVVSHSAPHGPETPAPQYSTAFPNAQAPRFPNWNFISRDKQWILRETPAMDAQKIAFVDLLHRRRLQTLLSVDDSIARIFRTLQSLGIENETYMFFTSDHGYHLGQFGQVKGKSMPFESDIRVPFYVRGSLIPKNIRVKDMVLNIDLAPTFLDIAGMKIPKDMDGVSVMKLFRKTKYGRRAKRRTHVVWRDTFLIERSRGWKRTKNMLEGRAGNRTIFSAKERKMTILEKICSKPKYQTPCQPKQLWECQTVNRRPRLRKCRRNTTTTERTAPTTRPTPPTTPVKMCVCMKPRPDSEMHENQNDMLPYEDEFIVTGMDYLTTELRRRSKRSRYSRYGSRRKAREFNARRYQKELSRALRLQNRRAKSRVLLRIPNSKPKPQLNVSGTPSGNHGSSGVQRVVEEKLGKLKEKIQGIRLRLGALRDRRKKLLQLSTHERLIQYPCPCNHGNDTMTVKVTTGNNGNGGYDDGDRIEEQNDEFQISSLRRRHKQPKPKATLRKTDAKKKKVKPRRSKCASPGVNCFYQTQDHWKLPPLWTGGEFCFCPNAANNSYWCLRTINATHNFLYCEFITDFYEYFDLNKDPYQLHNIIHEVSPAVLLGLHRQLVRMRGCKGEQCTHHHGKKHPTEPPPSPSINTPLTDYNDSFFKTQESHMITSPTVPSNVETSAQSSASPLTSETPSQVLVTRSDVIVNTPKSIDDNSDTTISSTNLEKLTTSAPTEIEVKISEQPTIQSTVRKTLNSEREQQQPESLKSENSKLDASEISSPPTENTETTRAPEKTSGLEGAPLNRSSEIFKNEKPDKELVNVAKPSQNTVTGSDYVPTVFVKSSDLDTSFWELNVSSIPPTSASTTSTGKENTDKMHLKISTLKPTRGRGKSTKRRENGEREGRKKEKYTSKDKQKHRSLKKSRKSKKKSSTGERSSLSTEDKKNLEIAKKQTGVFNKTSLTQGQFSSHVSENSKNEKPSQLTVTPLPGSDYVPTVFVKSSDPDTRSLELIASSIPPTLASTTTSSEENLKQIFTVKPTKRKSAERRKTNNLNERDTKQVIKTVENQTRSESKSENERPELENKGNEKGNKPLPEVSRKRNKKPANKRSANRNSKKRSKAKPSKKRPSPISQGGVTEGGVESPVENGGGSSFSQESSPSDP